MSETLYVSPSQLETKRTCRRKWWLDKVAHQPQEDKGYLEFGTVLHAVAERWLRADERGVDPQTGQAVDLYPPGWEACNDAGIPLPPDQQDLIRRLVKEAIDRGILRRGEGRQVEAKLECELAPATDDMPRIVLVGKADVLYPEGVEDHKTLKDWRYAQTSKSLAKNDQVLLYCWALGEMRKEQGLPPLEKYLVRHNQFGKDPLKPKVGHAEAWATAADVERVAFVARRDAEHMVRLREVARWQDVPGAEREGGCQKYGGCPYLRICSGELSLEQHAVLTESLNGDRLRARAESSERQAQHRKEVEVGSDVLKKLMEQRAARTAAAPAAKAPEVNSGVGQAAPAPSVGTPAQAPTVATAPATAAVRDVSVPGAPWASQDCPACAKAKAVILGVTPKGGVCVVCDTRSKRAGKPTSKDYVITPGEQPGTITWTPRPGGPAAAQPPTTAAVPAEPVREVASQAEEPQEAAAPAPEALSPAEEAAVEAEPPRRTSKSPPPAGPPAVPVKISGTGRPVGRPKKGFTLYVGCAPTRGASTTEPPVYLSQLLRANCDAIAEASGANFWDLDPFKRRDALVARAEAMGEELGTRDVVCDSADLIEARYMMDALADQAGKVVRAFSR